MDYKELIRQLRDTSNCDILDYVDDAADAIETMLKEKDLLLEHLKQSYGCSSCKHIAKCELEEPCFDCKRSVGENDRWEWSGFKK